MRATNTRLQPVHRPAIERNGANGHESLAKPDTITPVSPSALVPAIERVSAGIIDLVLSKMEASREKERFTVPINERLTVTLDQASSLSGLPRGYLLGAIRKKKLKAARRGRGWNIKRTDLDVYLKARSAAPLLQSAWLEEFIMTAEHTKARAAQNAKPAAAKLKRAKRAVKKPRRKTEASAN